MSTVFQGELRDVPEKGKTQQSSFRTSEKKSADMFNDAYYGHVK